MQGRLSESGALLSALATDSSSAAAPWPLAPAKQDETRVRQTQVARGVWYLVDIRHVK